MAESEGDAYIGVFLAAQGGAAAPVLATASPGRDLHVTLAHCTSSPAQLAALVARPGLLGARVAVRVTHRFSAAWAAGAVGAPASVSALVVGGLVQEEGGVDLLPCVASRAPHVTLRAQGAAPSVAAGAALRLLLAAAGGALPQAAAVVEAQGVRFEVEPMPLELVGIVSTCGE